MTVAACATPLLAFGGAATAGAATVTVPSVPSVVQQASAGEILTLVNEERKNAGCPALKSNPELTKAAQQHAEDMAKNNLTGHTGSDGSGTQQRIDKAGYNWSAWGENVSGPGHATAKDHVQGWLDDPPHKADMLRCSFTDTGVAVSGDRAVQVFGTPG
ncbi:CAP domain-containing protein [Streptomyces sp. NPDC059582]|uniref:CAP domain-containing protein n=1 Tax=Streptomyces sp. NPDC059582 TaxID=3346875 RepID=UPI0036A75703